MCQPEESQQKPKEKVKEPGGGAALWPRCACFVSREGRKGVHPGSECPGSQGRCPISGLLASYRAGKSNIFLEARGARQAEKITQKITSECAASGRDVSLFT